jgi:peptidoglycan/LPS O-acetylase OafA/YrhL
VLDGMRGIAAIAVMIYHFTMFQNVRILSNASVAVDLFFILSGFVIMHAYGGKIVNIRTFIDYIKRRFVRIYPDFLVGVILGLPVLFLMQRASSTNISTSGLIYSFALNIFCLPVFDNFFTNTMGSQFRTFGEIFPGNPPAWSLFFEIFISFFFPVLALCRMKMLSRIVIYSLAVLIIFSTINALSNHDFPIIYSGGWGAENFFCGIPRVFFGFSFGVLIYRLKDDLKINHWAEKLKLSTVNPVYLYCGILVIFSNTEFFYGLYTIFVIGVLLPAVVWVGSKVKITRSISKKWAHRLGLLSFPIYCIHFPIGRLFNLLSQYRPMPNWAIDMGAVATTLLLSTFLAVFYEPLSKKILSHLLDLRGGSSPG